MIETQSASRYLFTYLCVNKGVSTLKKHTTLMFDEAVGCFYLFPGSYDLDKQSVLTVTTMLYDVCSFVPSFVRLFGNIHKIFSSVKYTFYF